MNVGTDVVMSQITTWNSNIKMPIIQKQVDKGKFHQSHPIYYVGQGRYKGGSMTMTIQRHPIYSAQKQGGLFNLSSK